MEHVFTVTNRHFFKHKLNYTNTGGNVYQNFEDAVKEADKRTIFESSVGANNKVKIFVDKQLEYARMDVTSQDGKWVEIEVLKERVR